MKLTVKRKVRNPNNTIGELFVDGKKFCDTLEDTDRGLDQKMSLTEIRSKKVAAHTCIPSGTYKVTMKVVSPKYSTRAAYQFCGGRLPRLLDVPGYEGILIHIGNTDKDTEGCILVGQNDKNKQVINSTVTFKALYDKLMAGKDHTITIQ
jgi:hypothetical protein